jgi:hypothetical protein
MPFGGSKKAAEVATEALGMNKQVQLDLIALEVKVEKLQNIVHAMWEIIKQKSDVSDNTLIDLFTEIQKKTEVEGKSAEECPTCHRPLQDSSKACIYCGTIVEKRRLF